MRSPISRTFTRAAVLALLASLARPASAQTQRWQSDGPQRKGWQPLLSAYSADRGVVFCRDDVMNTWEWDGEEWMFRGKGGPPFPDNGLAWDRRRSVYVAPGYGSAVEFDPDPHSMWYEHDGRAWTSTRVPLGQRVSP